MDVSVIIVNYNTFDLTDKCISSIYKFTKEVSFEIILVDNASVECDAELFRQKYPEIVLVKNNENIGFARGNNAGVKLAKGNAILLLNSDTELVEDSVSLCYKKLLQLQDKVGIITCKLVYPDGAIQKQCYRFPSISLNLFELFRLQKLMKVEKRAQKFMGSYFDNCTDIIPDWIWGTFFMFKKELLDKMNEGKLNEDYFMYYEDVRWCYDFNSLGKKCYFNAQTKVLHHMSQSVKKQLGKIDMIQFNKLDFLIKVHGKAYMVFYSMLAATNYLFSSFNMVKNVKDFYQYISAMFRILFMNDKDRSNRARAV